MRAGIIVFPATNCEVDTKRACEFFGWETEYVWHDEKIEKDYDVIFLPGGFSYGDYISAGRLAKFSPAVESLTVGKSMIVGICNGFQILCEKNLLPGALTCNKDLKFLSEPCELEFYGEKIVLPIAHHQGQFLYTAGVDGLSRDCEVFLKYVEAKNGSDERIAGLYDRKKRILGLMPHPERAVFKETSLSTSGRTDGRRIFEFIENECR